MSLRGAEGDVAISFEHLEKPCFPEKRDCFASLAMTISILRLTKKLSLTGGCGDPPYLPATARH